MLRQSSFLFLPINLFGFIDLLSRIDEIPMPRKIINRTQKEECVIITASATKNSARGSPVIRKEIMLSDRCGSVQLTQTSTPNAKCFKSTRSAAMVALALRNPNSSTPNKRNPIAKPNESAESTFSIGNTQSIPTTLASQMNGLKDVYSTGSPSSGSDNDAINSTSVSSATALRRLYFKSGRSTKNLLASKTKLSMTQITRKAVSTAAVLYHSSIGGTLPDNFTSNSTGTSKVIIRGSSTASMTETNINTSTDSASTMITNVTHTDTSETCDSLDLVDNPGQSEQHFSSIEEPLITTIHADSEHEGTEIELTCCSLSQYAAANLHDSIESQESCLSVQMEEASSTTPLLSSHRKFTVTSEIDNIPSTAPVLINADKHFTFESPKSPKSAHCNDKSRNHFTFKEFGLNQYDGNHIYNKCVHHDSTKSVPCYNEAQKQTLRNSGQYGNKGIAKTKITAKGERRRSQSSSKINLTSITVKENQSYADRSAPLKFKGRQMSSPSSSAPSNQRKYSSSSSSGSNEHYRDANGIIHPFEREIIEYDHAQHPISSSSSSTSDSDDIEPCSVHERKYVAQFTCNNNKMDLYQQYMLLNKKNDQKQQHQQHQQQQKQQPQQQLINMNVKYSKRVKSDITISKYLTASDAFTPQPKTISPPNVHLLQPITTIHSELSKFNDIAEKFDQMPSRSGMNIVNPYNNDDSKNLTLTRVNYNETMASSTPSNSPNNPTIPNDLQLKKSLKTKTITTHMNEVGTDSIDLMHDLFSSCQFTATTCGNLGTNPNNVGPINVTTNPLEVIVCAQPRATIVVQQPSLSLDNTVETLLIRNENDFVSVEQGQDVNVTFNSHKRNSQYIHQQLQQEQQQQQHKQLTQQQKRDDNIKQLLDVTNTLTFQELRDFEMRYGSPHHSRSQSVKAVNTRTMCPPNQLCLPQQRSRVASMPNTGVEEEYYRLRHFSITGKGVINRGDSLKSRRSRSNNSVTSSNSSNEHLTTIHPTITATSNRNSAACSLASSRESSTSNPGTGPYRVLMLGAPAVGKSSLVSQFMTSEYLHAYDTSIDDDSGEKSVSVLLNGEESELIFIDHAYAEMTTDDCLNCYDPHGYCIIYSTADRSSFNLAERALQVLWTNQNIAQKAVILVANKADLARSRLITAEEGKTMATAYDCKFIETSVGINHNVDELLVGLLSQIRLKLEHPEKSRDLFRKRSVRKSKRRACSPLSGACLVGSINLNSSNVITNGQTPPGSAHSSPRKYRGSRTSTSLKVKGLLGRVWARDSKSKSCENLHVL